MLRPAIATNSGAVSVNVLPKFDAIHVDYSMSVTAMRIGVFAAMLAMTAIVAVL